MYNSIKSWINVPATIKKFSSYDGAGDKVYDEDNIESIFCYPEGHSMIIKDNTGNYVVSKLKVYVEGLTNIAINDEVTIDGEAYEVRSLAPFYMNGSKDLLVVYL